jgi:hypothetical protein
MRRQTLCKRGGGGRQWWQWLLLAVMTPRGALAVVLMVALVRGGECVCV